MKLLRKVTSIFDGTLSIAAFLVVALLTFIMLAMNYEVVMRYFLGRPALWVMELTTLSLLFITFLGAAWVLKGEGHVNVDIVLNRLKPKTQALFNIITSILGVIICLALVWYGARVTWQHYQLGLYPETELEIPNAFSLFIIPVGSFLLLVQFLRRTYGYLGSWRASRDE